jgi:hypothetical protein
VRSREEPVNLEAIIRQPRTERAATTDSEARLDALLAQCSSAPDADAPQEIKRVDPLERLRELFSTRLAAVVVDLREKYGTSGVCLDMDAEKFLGGGRDLTITIEFAGQGARLDGTVTNGAIAFRLTRYLHSDRSGLTGSGPTLRTRDLTPDAFRAFLCERIAALVRSVLKHQV